MSLANKTLSGMSLANKNLEFRKDNYDSNNVQGK